MPPRIAETEECAQRACFRMDEVTVIHSVVTRATGSIAIGRGSDMVESDISSGRCARGVTLHGGGIEGHLEIDTAGLSMGCRLPHPA